MRAVTLTGYALLFLALAGLEVAARLGRRGRHAHLLRVAAARDAVAVDPARPAAELVVDRLALLRG